MIATAQDTGWLSREDGSLTRLIRFTSPVSALARGHLVLAYLHGDAPPGRKVLPGEHTDDLSCDGFMLRIRILPIKRTVPYSPVYCNNSLFRTVSVEVMA